MGSAADGRVIPRVFDMPGGNEFRLRQRFACASVLPAAKRSEADGQTILSTVVLFLTTAVPITAPPLINSSASHSVRLLLSPV